ncbi:MAG: GNAT family N-acetyltransferase [Bosea sp. (in: a-proteobacteria)]
MVTIRDEHSADFAAREALLDRAQGPARYGKSSVRLRDGRLPAQGLALSAEVDGQLVGTVRLWHVDAGGTPALLLGPLAVSPEYQGAGIGKRLMREVLWRAAMRGHEAVLLVGDADYYARFGFSAELTRELDMPGQDDHSRFLALELAPGALAGARGDVVATGDMVQRRRADMPARLAA